MLLLSNTNDGLMAEMTIVLCALFIIGILVFILFMNNRHRKTLFNFAYVDSLTGLKNINWFNKKAQELLKNKRGRKYAIYSFDVRNFKYINECYGRETGDKVLIQIAETLKKYISGETLFIRRDIDKYHIFSTYDSKDTIITAVNMLEKRMIDDIKNNLNFVLDFSCGIYLLDDKETDIEKAIDRAEIARKETKKPLNPNLIFFDEQMAKNIHLEKMMEENMEYALSHNEFEVYLQPQYNLSEMKLVGVESLVRWNSSKLGFLYPDSFINFFERNGFISKLDFYVMKVVCDRLQNLYDTNQSLYHVAVNHSRVTIMDDDYLFNLGRFFGKYTFPKRFIEIEITENVFIVDHKRASEMIEGIRSMGIGVSMDDFGSGYSSLNVLKEVPFNVLKIDREFLDEQMAQKTLAIVKGVVNMAKDINIHVICEGVETKEQVDFLRKIGCEMAQGYYFAKPMTMDSFDILLRNKNIC